MYNILLRLWPWHLLIRPKWSVVVVFEPFCPCLQLPAPTWTPEGTAIQSPVCLRYTDTHTHAIRVCPYLRANRWRQRGCSQKNWSPRSGYVVTAARDFCSYDRNAVCRLLLQGHRIKVWFFLSINLTGAHSPNFHDNVGLVLARTTKTELEEHFLCQNLKDCYVFFVFVIFILCTLLSVWDRGYIQK